MMEALRDYSYDFIAFALSVGLVVGYHYYLRLRLRHDRSYTIQAINTLARNDWVKSIMNNSGKDVLAVQTLRNSTMAATFLASTAILLGIGVLNLSEQADKLTGIFHSLNYFGSTGKPLWLIKILLLLSDFLWAFFSFSLAIRMYNHVGYLINTPTDYCGHGNTPGYVGKLLNRGGAYYGTGMRCYYLSVPLIFWLFGPLLLLGATAGIIAVLYHLDRSPDEMELREAVPGNESTRAREARNAVVSLR